MKLATSVPTILLVVSAGLLSSTRALSQAPAAGTPSAKDEAIPSLRDVPVVALTHIRVIDGTGAPAKEDQTLVIEGGRIFALGRSGEVKVPEKASTLDLAGHTVLPGLVMLHEHLFWYFPDPGLSHPEHFSFPRLYLAYGVTTLRTAGTD